MTNRIISDWTDEGKSNSRTMLEKIDRFAAGGFAKEYRTMPDGSTVMAHTRGDMAPEITSLKSSEKAKTIYGLYAIPASSASPFGFGVGDVPMTAPNETTPGSANVRIINGAVTVTKNQAWVKPATLVGVEQHPGNAVWSDDRIPVADRKRVSWWIPRASTPDLTTTPAPGSVYSGLGDATMYQASDSGWYIDYRGAPFKQGRVFIDGELYHQFNMVILSAALYVSGGVEYLRFISPEYNLDPADNNYNRWGFFGFKCYQFDPSTSTTTLIATISDVRYTPDRYSAPMFNASATKIVFQANTSTGETWLEANWGGITGQSLDIRTKFGYSLEPIYSENSTATYSPNIIYAWYEGDFLRHLMNQDMSVSDSAYLARQVLDGVEVRPWGAAVFRLWNSLWLGDRGVFLSSPQHLTDNALSDPTIYVYDLYGYVPREGLELPRFALPATTFVVDWARHFSIAVAEDRGTILVSLTSDSGAPVVYIRSEGQWINVTGEFSADGSRYLNSPIFLKQE